MKIAHEKLKRLTSAIFSAAGCNPPEAERLGRYLTEANLVGHDSHGVIRIPYYIDWLRAGKVLANQSLQIVFETDVIAVVDGQYGFGQSIGEQATQLGIDKSARHGVSVIALRNTGHLGRIGDWPLMAARAGKISLHFVNTSGAGILVSPFGGINRRLSANPIAAGVPVKGGPPILLDMSCCTIAEGKLKVALNKGVNVPDGCIIDSTGQPTTDPKVFYGDPPGAILSIAGHKGYGLGVITEILAGALSGGGASNPANAGRLANGMLSIYMDPARFQEEAPFAAEVRRFIEWVKSSEKTQPNGEIYMPGEIEERTKARRLGDGIELDDTTWKSIAEVCRSLKVPVETV
jgi:hydroxycarboxylate dehydrogenase B